MSMISNRYEINADIVLNNMQIMSQLTEQTKAGFDGNIYPVIMPAGRHGPYYQVSDKDLGNKNLVNEFKKHSRHSRTSCIKDFIKEKSIGTSQLDLFIDIEEEHIEMDADFSLLKQLKDLIPSKYRDEFEKKYMEKSRGRWLGATKPDDFNSADELYCLDHLKNNKSLYLYEIYFEIPSNIPHLQPVLFIGKVKNGTAMQFKFNKHALECINSVTFIILKK